ncbi:MAG: hypothetical protein M2R45_05097 [Verrucomicrobia subdivision 3 bacterium]|nr:hypothetical protein [Limisphaerales bacterium]MCS1417770.1 hypothetical protein [Limisphaerales bacterium]
MSDIPLLAVIAYFERLEGDFLGSDRPELGDLRQAPVGIFIFGDQRLEMTDGVLG